MSECHAGCNCHAAETKVDEMMKLIRQANDIYDSLTVEQRVEADKRMEALAE